jgi:osmotically inducible lipoprotein OsmB
MTLRINRVTLLAALAAISLTTAGCDHMSHQQQRALSGGAIGTAAGVGLGLVTGVNPWVLGAIGAGAGAATGALTH